jgi:hypothetical protein
MAKRLEATYLILPCRCTAERYTFRCIRRIRWRWTVDTLCAGCVLVSNAAMSSLFLALREQPSDNTILKNWKDVRSRDTKAYAALTGHKHIDGAVMSRVPESTLLSGFAISNAGYATASFLLYYRTRALGAILSMVFIILVLADSWLNLLMVTPVERMMVALPAALDAGLLLALLVQAMEGKNFPKEKALVCSV